MYVVIFLLIYIQVKQTIRVQKVEYNKEIKEYTNITKKILNEEKLLEEIEKIITKINYKQNIRLTVVNSEFVKHFNEYSYASHPEIIEAFMDFLGFEVTPHALLKVNIPVVIVENNKR